MKTYTVQLLRLVDDGPPMVIRKMTMDDGDMARGVAALLLAQKLPEPDAHTFAVNLYAEEKETPWAEG